MPFLKLRNLELKTPLMLASGTWGLGENLDLYLTKEEIKSNIGAFVSKGISRLPKKGNPPPRLYETPCGLINSIGLENPGLEVFKRDYLPKLFCYGVPLIINLHGEEVEDFVALVEGFKEENVDGIELNISCPNVKKGGIAFSSDPKGVKTLVKEVRKVWEKFLAVKLSPVGPVYEIAEICEKEGVDALVVANTYPALGVIDLAPLKVIKGGLSGPAIKPLTLRLVYELAQKVKLPIIGSGGILSGKDALEYLVCGAKAFQIGVANLIDPTSPVKIIQEMEEIKKKHGLFG
ncbi:dihydroorotate dehydrogenase [Thermodesulfobacterium hveragerdense]|uniref:dihydroorotate dehydrogenase n=1 Tax=Thermodesulfobacterium hveragerdense TaxID=53424 RepID=UPI000414C1A0|nr:dihydroorotate dehydrogenase [Thermodesulfobacterium hveragerdense]